LKKSAQIFFYVTGILYISRVILIKTNKIMTHFQIIDKINNLQELADNPLYDDLPRSTKVWLRDELVRYEKLLIMVGSELLSRTFVLDTENEYWQDQLSEWMMTEGPFPLIGGEERYGVHDLVFGDIMTQTEIIVRRKYNLEYADL
jgi:hypothetical protein